jgi:hypothetical protein
MDLKDFLLELATGSAENQNLNCTICGLSMNSGGIGLKTADGTAIHMECLEEHCTQTNCFGCKIGKYPDCVFQDMKKALMKADTGGNENG